jgi:hypothetical protein
LLFLVVKFAQGVPALFVCQIAPSELMLANPDTGRAPIIKFELGQPVRLAVLFA